MDPTSNRLLSLARHVHFSKRHFPLELYDGGHFSQSFLLLLPAVWASIP